jgi:plastocyanin
MRRASLIIVLAACGGGGDTKTDAKQTDAPVATVVTVTCTGSPPTVVEVDGTNAFMPNAVTITQGQVVKFTSSMTHNVVPNPLNHPDSGLNVGFNMTKCLMFTHTGTFGFMCQPHGFTGAITVN